MKLARRIFSELAARTAVGRARAGVYGDEEIKEYLQAPSDRCRSPRPVPERSASASSPQPGPRHGLGTRRDPGRRTAHPRTLPRARRPRRPVPRRGVVDVRPPTRPSLDRRRTVPGDRGRVQPRRRLLRHRRVLGGDVAHHATAYSAHTIVRVGSIIEADGAPDRAFEPVLYPGGRADFELGGRGGEGPTSPWLR